MLVQNFKAIAQKPTSVNPIIFQKVAKMQYPAIYMQQYTSRQNKHKKTRERFNTYYLFLFFFSLNIINRVLKNDVKMN